MPRVWSTCEWQKGRAKRPPRGQRGIASHLPWASAATIVPRDAPASVGDGSPHQWHSPHALSTCYLSLLHACGGEVFQLSLRWWTEPSTSRCVVLCVRAPATLSDGVCARVESLQISSIRCDALLLHVTTLPCARITPMPHACTRACSGCYFDQPCSLLPQSSLEP